ncbi:MAG: serine/threonine-protein kinase [Planctomycetota bacterium]|nr:serine/threonine-protein kinase [Planctomycetota bacterium]
MLTESKPEDTSNICFQRAKELYLEATRMPQAEITTFLDAQCGDDNALRREVELLLELESSEPTWIPDPPETLIQAPELMPDDVVAGHRIIRKLGEGGMGTVYLAQDLELNCAVAFKVLHRAYDTPVFNEQFVKERQTLAMMQHPGIAGVRQAGVTPEGQAWFTMDYIDGLPLTTYCEENTLDIQARLGLLIKVCEAVQYAHGKMVIHRDLNPNNILVTTDDRGQPQPHLIDFGISRLLEQAEMTDDENHAQLPARCGTPPYMSPEQYLGHEDQVEVRSDIYALGVLLYKLTTGQEPFERKLLKMPIQELGTFLEKSSPQLPSDRFLQLPSAEQDLITSKQNTTVRKLVKRLRDGIDWIAFTAVNPRREDRYSSADAMASDLKRFLSLQPLEAVPSSRTYRTRLFLRRNWVATATITLVIYLLITGTSVALYQAARIQARLQESNAYEQLLRESFFDELQPNYLFVQPYAHPEAKAEQMRRLVERFDASPPIGEVAVARIRSRIGNVFSLLKLYPEAEKQLLLARDVFASLDGNHGLELDRINLALDYIEVMTGRSEHAGPTSPTQSQEQIQSVIDQMHELNSNRSTP